MAFNTLTDEEWEELREEDMRYDAELEEAEERRRRREINENDPWKMFGVSPKDFI